MMRAGTVGLVVKLYPWEKRAVDAINLSAIERFLGPLFVVYVVLNFLDISTTLLALSGGNSLVELNPLGAQLFRFGYAGFLFAYFMKYVPAIPLFFMAFHKDRTGRYGVEERLLKFTALIALAAGNIYLGYIVLLNNLPHLLAVTGLTLWI